jgi:hypothetical protein
MRDILIELIKKEVDKKWKEFVWFVGKKDTQPTKTQTMSVKSVWEM